MRAPHKPKTTKAQVDILWDTVHNHVLSRLELNTRLLWIILGGLIVAALIDRIV